MLIVSQRLIQAENTLSKADKREIMNKVKQLKSICGHMYNELYIYKFKSACGVHVLFFSE